MQKPHSTRRWLVLAAILATILLAGVGVVHSWRQARPAEFSVLAGDCRAAMEASPRAEALEALLAQKKIQVRRKEAPFTKDALGFADILENAGFTATDMRRAGFCLYFENVGVRSHIFGASHLAFGYFLFTPEGSLIGYKVSSTHFGL